MDAAYDLCRPDPVTTGVIYSSPHSGCAYPEDFLQDSILSPELLRSSEDAFVDRLFDAAPGHGAPLLRAVKPRAWIDLNRACDELDPGVVDGIARGAHNPRVASGLGVIPRVVSGGRPIYSGKIARGVARARIDADWRPYHRCLSDLVREARRRFGRAILIDCHSMPHEALEGTSAAARRPDVVLGDRFGAAAAPGVMDAVEAAIVEAGFSVSRNAPFAGAYIAQHYGRPAHGVHVIQIEIDRRLYMDETTISPHAGFDAIKARIDRIVARISDLGRPDRALLEAAE